MILLKQKIAELLELANCYPSPHNGQPINIRQINDNDFDFYFEKSRGLQATDISFIFSFASMGVFIEHFTVCAKALGHDFSFLQALPQEKDLQGDGVIKFGRGRVAWDATKLDPKLKEIIQTRQTSRKKYYEGPPATLSDSISKIAADTGMSLRRLDAAERGQAIWLNQRAVFDDMADEKVRQELHHWLRYSKQQKNEMKDGLAYDCMELNGRLLKYIVEHPAILRQKGIAWMLREYYLRTMTDKSDVFYMMAPFKTAHDSFEVGKTIMKIWLQITREGYYIHPFGTIMSNRAAHEDFLRLVGVHAEPRESSYLVFIFRCGKSEKPIRSLRIPVDQHLILE